MVDIEEEVNILEQESFFKENSGMSVQREEGKLKRIDFCGTRVYETPEGKYYPSVTTILSALPPSPFFLDWLSDVGHNSKAIRDRAAYEGTQVHEAIEHLLKGEKIEWVNQYGQARYNLNVWKMILKFQNFYELCKPITLASEMFLWSDEYEYAGTTDYLCQIANKTWLIDFKTSNHLNMLTYGGQLAAYAKALEERKKIKVDNCGILWLKASTRTAKFDPKRNIMQGEGWQLVVLDSIEKSFKIFSLAREMYRVLNPEIKPYLVSYPTEISLTK